MIDANGQELAADLRDRRQRLTEALAVGLRRIAVAVDAEQERRLNGAGAPGAYPVPVRTGNLRGSHFFDVQTAAGMAIVGNTAAYAHIIHDGASYTRAARTQTLRYSRHARTGRIGTRFTKADRAGFETEVQIGAHAVEVRGRPFLRDAAEAVDSVEILAIEVQRISE